MSACLFVGSTAPAWAVPTNLQAPEVVFDSGQAISSAEVGQTLECGAGSWAGVTGSEFEYEWLRNGVPIAPGFRPELNHLVVPEDAGRTLTCRVLAQGEGGDTEAESGNSVHVGGGEPESPPEPPPVGEGPKVLPAGNTTVGAMLDCEAGPWSGNPAPKFAYEWLLNGEAKVGEGPSYTVTESDEGQSLSCEVKATNTAGTKSAVSENSVHVEGEAPKLKSGSEPQVLGTAEVGKTLTCKEGEWTGSPTFTYEWLSEKSPLTGQTGSTYVVEASQENKTISCKVTAKNAVGSTTAESRGVQIGAGPVLLEPPTISPAHNIAPGSTLTCGHGSWSGSPTFEYQWVRDGDEEIASGSPKYTVVKEDEGQTLACQVTATNGHGKAISTSVAVLALKQGASEELLSSLGEPAIEGTPAVGATLTCRGDQSAGEWEPDASSYSVEWFRGATPVATEATYVVQSADVGTEVSCVVTAFNSKGSGEDKSRGILVKGSAPELAAGSAPSVSGEALLGETLTCATGKWTGSPAPSFAYEWLRNGTPTGVKASGYVIGTADEGFELSCRVTAENTAGKKSAVSNSVSVPGNAPHNTGAPQIEGTAAANQVLKCSSGTWTGEPAPSFSYQWIVEGVEVTGATSDLYTVTTSDEGHSIVCQVTATSRAGTTKATSVSVHVPGKGPRVVGVGPQITGAAEVGEELTCDRGAWEGRPPPTFSYQWLMNEVPIAGATQPTLTVEPGDQGQLITCVVHASNGEGSYEAATQGVAIPYSVQKTESKKEDPVVRTKPVPRITIPEIEASLKAQLTKVDRGARTASVLKSDSFSFSITSLEAGTLQVFWYEVPKGAHISKKSHPKPVLVASVKVEFTGAAKQKVKMKLTTAGRRLLKPNKSMKLTVRAEFTTPRGTIAAWTGPLTLAG